MKNLNLYNKYEIFEVYNSMSNHPTNENAYYRNYLLNFIVNKKWLKEYINSYPNPFGI